MSRQQRLTPEQAKKWWWKKLTTPGRDGRSPLISKTNYLNLSLSEKRAAVRDALSKMLSTPHGLILTSNDSKASLKEYTKKDGWTQSRWLRDAIQGDLRNLSAKLIAAALLLEFREETMSNFMRIAKNYGKRRINIWRPIRRGSGMNPHVYFWPPREGEVFLPGVNDKVKELVKRDIKTFPVSQLLPALNRYDKKASREAKKRGQESYSGFLTNKDLLSKIASYNFSMTQKKRRKRKAERKNSRKNSRKSSRKGKKKQEFLYNPDNPEESFDVYIDKNPKDSISMAYSNLNDVKKTIRKLERLYKKGKYDHRRIKQVAMIMMVRLRVFVNRKDLYPNAKNTKSRHNLAKRYHEFLSKRTKVKNEKQRKKMVFKIE